MDEFGSPLIGGIRAVRRNISSSFFGAPRQSQPDPVTTDLLQQQSLTLTSISQQLQSVSNQISTFDQNLQGVKENLAISDQLTRQREAARQNRERILAEQGLREGKESALENKIQQSLTQPLQRVGVKTQGVLGRLQNFFLILAGGWLTSTGIDLLQALSEGNVDKINELKTKFIGGLAVIAGTMTAISLGIKSTLGILGKFVANVARVAFGGLLKGSLNGVRLLLAGLVKGAAKLPGGVFGGGGIGSFIRGIVENVIAFKILGGGGAGANAQPDRYTSGGGGATTGTGPGMGKVTEPLQMRKDGAKHGNYTKAAEHAIINAVVNGDISVVEKHLNSGVNIDSKSISGVTPLSVAVEEGHINIIKLLLENGPDLNGEVGGINVLDLALSANKNNEIVDILRKYGAKTTEELNRD